MPPTLEKIRPPLAARKGKTWHDLAPGAGTSDQVIDEPGAFVTKSGKVLFTAGGERERLTFTPLEEPTTGAVKREDRAALAAGADGEVPGHAGITAGGVAPPEYITDYETRPTVNGSTGRFAVQVKNPAYETYQAAQANKAPVYNAQTAANTASQQYINEQAQANHEAAADVGRIRTGALNTADKAAVAGANQRTDNQDYEFQAFGMKSPTRIAVEPGASALNGTPGVTEGYQTQEEIAQHTADLNNQARGFTLENSRLNAASAGISASQAGVDYARNNESQSSANPGAATAAAVRAEEARMEQIRAAGSRAGMAATNNRVDPGSFAASGYTGGSAPAPSAKGAPQYQYNLGGSTGPGGSVPDYGQSTPGSASYLRFAAEKAGNKIVEDPTSGPAFGTPTSYIYSKDLDAKTDTFGNIRQPGGGYVDPRNGNIFVNGHWTDPRTGNVLINTRTWQSPDGMQYRITNPKTGAGYWQDKDGFVLGSDGEWSNRVTGQVKIDGVVYQAGRPLSTRLYKGGGGAEEPTSGAIDVPFFGKLSGAGVASDNAWK